MTTNYSFFMIIRFGIRSKKAQKIWIKTEAKFNLGI